MPPSHRLPSVRFYQCKQIRVVNAVQGNSGVSCGVGYLAQTISSITAEIVLGGISLQSPADVFDQSVSPVAIRSE